MSDANEFQYKIGADLTALDRALGGSEQLLERFDAGVRDLVLQLSALTGVATRYAATQRDTATSAQQFLAQIDRQNAALKAQAANFGRTEAELLRVKAAELGVAQQASTSIASIERLTAARAKQAADAQRAAAGERALANIRAAAQAQERSAYLQQQEATRRAAQEKAQFIAQLEREVRALGKTRAELLQLKAAQLGASQQAAPLIAALASARGGGQGLLGGGNIAAQLLGVGTAAGGILFAANALRSLASTLIEAQSQADRLQLKFTAGFGAAQAAREIDFVRQTSNELGINFQSVAEQYAKFAAATKGTSLEGERTREVFRASAESAAVLGLNVEETEGILRAFGQIASKGRAQLEELSGQLGDRLVGALNKAARGMGVTTAELLDMVKQGDVLATDFLPKLARVMREDVAGSTDLAAQRIDAFTNRLANAQQRLAQEVVKSGFGDFIKGQLAILTDGLTGVSEAYERARAEGDGFAGQTGAALAAVAGFLNPANAVSYGAQSLEGRIKAARDRLKELQDLSQQRPGPVLERMVEQAQALVDKLEEAKRGAGGRSAPDAASEARFSQQEVERRQADERRSRAVAEYAKLMADLKGETSAYAKAVDVVNRTEAVGAIDQSQKLKDLALIEQKLNAEKKRGGGESDRAIKRETQSTLRGIDARLREELASVQFFNQIAAGLYDQNLTNVGEFYARKLELQQRANQANARAIDQEIAALTRLRDGARDPVNREEAESRLTDKVRERAAAQQDAARSEILLNLEREAAYRQLAATALQVEQDLARLRGDEDAAAGARDIGRLQEFSRFNRSIGGDSAREDEFRRLLDIQRELESAQRNIGRIAEQSSLAEREYLLAATQRAATQLETERGLFVLRTRQLALLAQEIERVRALAEASPRNTPLQIELQKLTLQYKELAANVDEGLNRLRAFQDEAAGTFGQFAGSVVKDIRSAGDALRQLGDSLFNMLNRELIEKPVQDFVRQQLRSLTEGGGPLAGLFGGIFGVQGGGAGAAAALSQETAASVRTATQTSALIAAEAAATAASTAAIVAAISGSTLAIVSAISAQSLASGGASLFAGGLGGTGFGTGSLFGNMDYGLFFHRGGVVGRGGDVGLVPRDVFAGAPRMHAGGIAGDEVPAILRKGEEVLTQSDPRHVDNGGAGGRPMSMSYAPVFSFAGAADRRTVEQVQAAAYEGMVRAMRRGTAGAVR